MHIQPWPTDRIVTATIINNLMSIYSLETRSSNVKPIHASPVGINKLGVGVDLFETGIKVVDLITPYKKGGKIGLFDGAGVGKTVVIMELIRNLAVEHVQPIIV